MATFRYFYEGRITFSKPIRDHQFLLRCAPCENSCQQVRQGRVEILPPARLTHGSDAFGNQLVYGHQVGDHSSFVFTSEGMVEQTDYRIEEPNAHPMYRRPSPLTMVQPVLKSWAEELTVSLPEDAFEKAVAVAQAVHRRLKYDCTLTNCNTTAAQAVELGGGVCQDFAHVTLALCRLVGLKARYANGFIPGEGFSHAWVEVHDGQCWRGVDPTNDCLCGAGYIKVAHGRDANDCPLNRGVFSGFTWQTMEVKVVVEESNKVI